MNDDIPDMDLYHAYQDLKDEISKLESELSDEIKHMFNAFYQRYPVLELNAEFALTLETIQDWFIQSKVKRG